MRAGLNKDARYGSILARIALLLWLAMSILSRQGGGVAQFVGTAILGVLPFVVILAVGGIVFSVRGLRAAKRLGGQGLSIVGICFGIAAIVFPTFAVVIAYSVG